LRLDIAEGRKVIAAGKPGESELYARITSNETDKRMPPAKSGKSLTKNEVELIRRWIEQGAEYQLHWSFAVAKRAATPAVGDSTWPRNAIDRFVFAKLQVHK